MSILLFFTNWMNSDTVLEIAQIDNLTIRRATFRFFKLEKNRGKKLPKVSGSYNPGLTVYPLPPLLVFLPYIHPIAVFSMQNEKK
jgi:hypothetical protein